MGIGIKFDRLVDVFEFFVMIKDKGMGLGLIFCWIIVEEYGGSFWVLFDNEYGVMFFLCMLCSGWFGFGDIELYG